MKSTGQPFHEPTLWQEDTPANHSAPPAVEQVPTTLDTFGRCSPTVFAWFDPDTRCWKTCQGTFLSDSEMCKPTWPRSGMTRGGIAYQLQPSAPRTSATAYSLSLHGELQWTPTATANQDAPSMEQRAPGRHLWATPTTQEVEHDDLTVNEKGRRAFKSKPGRGWALGLADQVRLWPTPDASPHKYRLQGHSQQSRSLNGVHGGKLNPEWVEWLMGFPIGWTDCED